MVRVTQDANGAWLHHHSEGKIHRILQPPFSESAEDMTMSDLKFLSMLQGQRRAKEYIAL